MPKYPGAYQKQGLEMVQKSRLEMAFILFCFSYHKLRQFSETPLTTTGTTDQSSNYPHVWLQPMALPVYFLLLSMRCRCDHFQP